MSLFPNTDKTKTPYKFSKKQVRDILKMYFPSLKMQIGDTFDVLVFTLTFDGHFHKGYTTRFVIVHRSIDGAVLIWENERNDWGGETFIHLFGVDGLSSHVDVCESIADFEGFLAQISNNLETGRFNCSNLKQVPMEFASIKDMPIKDAHGKYIRLPFTTIDGSYKYRKGDFVEYLSRINDWWKKYKATLAILYEMNPAFD